MTGLKTLAAFSAELAFPDSNEYIYGLRNLNFAPSSTKNLL